MAKKTKIEKIKIADGIYARARADGEPMVIAPKRSETKDKKLVGMSLSASTLDKFTFHGAKKEAIAAALLWGWRDLVLLEKRLVGTGVDFRVEKTTTPPLLLGCYVVEDLFDLQVHLDPELHAQLARDMGLSSMAKIYPLLFSYCVQELSRRIFDDSVQEIDRKNIVIVVDD